MKNICGQLIDSDIKWFEEIRKLATDQSENYTTGYLLDYEYIKSHYRLTAVKLSRKNNWVVIQKQFTK